ncbi:MAG TPA: NAD-dependent epimerase/dehydratase family protein [Candidatus Cybelea sp.]|jgi:GDP-4-dehydro-6-deoxy-D-mannose reductase|nr:NAD-dependent epimerase/dehydratase family protein [Candidatus Cybelea sp.]
MTRALVTGAQGFVGRYLVAELLAADPAIEVSGVGRSPARATFTHRIALGRERVLAPLPAELAAAGNETRYRYFQADIRDREALRTILHEFRPQWIFHLASGLRDDSPKHLFGTNVEGTIDLLETVAGAASPVERIVMGSSGSVYGTPRALPLEEDTPCEPGDFYAVSKLAQEHAARLIAGQHGLHLAVARIFNILGAGQDERHVAGRFASQIAAIEAGSVPPRLQTGDLLTARDFIDVRDVARALVLLARQPKLTGTYNVAAGAATPIGDVLRTLLDLARLNRPVEIERTYFRAADAPCSFAGIARLRAAGYAPSVPLDRSLGDVLEYYRQNLRIAKSASHRGAKILAQRA